MVEAQGRHSNPTETFRRTLNINIHKSKDLPIGRRGICLDSKRKLLLLSRPLDTPLVYHGLKVRGLPLAIPFESRNVRPKKDPLL